MTPLYNSQTDRLLTIRTTYRNYLPKIAKKVRIILASHGYS